MSITQAIELLKTYNGPLGLKLHDGASEELINKVERTCGLNLPAAFKTLYRFTDGFETVEDIFNMIPLAEIIDIKEHNKPLWIAEYMIYCDMWGLEASPDNPDDYSIFSVDFESGKIILTNSLAEFIVRFLKGGVFEIGGLYAWAAEIKARLYGNTDPEKIKPLIWVYRECLKRSLMTKKDIIAWSDWIIATEDEPNHYFIDVSLSRDTNELATTLNAVYLTDNALQVRAFFSRVYIQLLVDQMTTDYAISVLDGFLRDEQLTAYERGKMMDFIVEWDNLNDFRPNPQSKQQLHEKIKDFFENYKEFNFYYVKNWEKINAKLMEKFENM